MFCPFIKSDSKQDEERNLVSVLGGEVAYILNFQLSSSPYFIVPRINTKLVSRAKVQSLHIYLEVPSTFYHSLNRLFNCVPSPTIMATKIKGIYKGFKFISKIFVVKEREMEVGYPTDVKHVAHIGWDGPSGIAPSWMNEFKTGPDFTATSIGNSRDFEQSMGCQPATGMIRDLPSMDLPNIPKKQKRKKKTISSPKCFSPKSSRTSKTKATNTQLGSSTGLEI
ncbi:hypothetical protein CRYUN_Cryun32bG0025200 [Craigia yunnanensis]